MSHLEEHRGGLAARRLQAEHRPPERRAQLVRPPLQLALHARQRAHPPQPRAHTPLHVAAVGAALHRHLRARAEQLGDAEVLVRVPLSRFRDELHHRGGHTTVRSRGVVKGRG